MRFAILAIVIFWLSVCSAFAENNSYKVDLDRDGKEEFVVVNQHFDTLEDKPPLAIEAIVSVFTHDWEEIGSFAIPNQIKKIEFTSLNRDDIRQIIAWSSAGGQYTSIAIYGYRDGGLYNIFRNGGICPIKVDFNTDPPIIKVARANWQKKGWSYASDDPLWQIYIWSGEEFVYNKELSTTSQISEEEEKDRYTDKVKSLAERLDKRIDLLLQNLENRKNLPQKSSDNAE